MSLEETVKVGVVKKQVLFGTANDANVEHIRSYLEAIPVEILSPSCY